MTGPLLVWGMCMTMVTGPSRRVAVNAAPKNEQGDLSSTAVTIKLLGSTMGVGVSSALVNAGLGKSAVLVVSGGLLVFACVIAVLVLSNERANSSKAQA